MKFTEEELEKLKEVARLLGAGFEMPDAGNHTPTLSPHGKFFSIIIRNDYRTKRHRFVVLIPKEYGETRFFRLSHPSICVSLTRSAEAISNDLKRRLFAEADQFFKEFIKRRNEYRERILDDKLAREELALANNRLPAGAEIKTSTLKGMELETPIFRKSATHFYAKITLKSFDALKMVAAICGEDYDLRK